MSNMKMKKMVVNTLAAMAFIGVCVAQTNVAHAYWGMYGNWEQSLAKDLEEMNEYYDAQYDKITEDFEKAVQEEKAKKESSASKETSSSSKSKENPYAAAYDKIIEDFEKAVQEEKAKEESSASKETASSSQKSENPYAAAYDKILKDFEEAVKNGGESSTGQSSAGRTGGSSRYVKPDYSIKDNRQSCEICGGRGKVECSSCHGLGYFSFRKSAPNYGSGSHYYTEKVTCRQCDGRKLADCLYCVGGLR